MEAEALVEEITEESISTAIHPFQNGKTLDPDGFTLDFFLGFYGLLKGDLLKVVRESQISNFRSNEHHIHSLIPKKQKGETFEDFRPISCCNMNYKIIVETIALRLKPVLRTVISKEKFGFLFNRKIHDPVS